MRLAFAPGAVPFTFVALATALVSTSCARTSAVDADIRATQPASSAAASAQALRVVVDESLLARGRIEVGPPSPRLVGDGQAYVGEVRAGGAGHSEAGALVTGRVASLEIDVGQQAKKGQVLAWVDAPEAGRAASEFLRADARAEVAARKLARQRRLEQQEATSANAVDDALLEQRLASAELAAARLWLTGIGATPSGAAAVSVRVPVRSPMDGVVSARHVVLGGSVTPEHALFEIRSIDSSVVVVVHVPETAPTLVGDEAMLTPRGAMTQRCRARVVGGLGVIDERTRSRVVRLAPSALCAGLLPGGFVTASFVGKPRSDGDATSDDLVVPNEAVVDVRGVEMVFVASDARGAFIAHPVTVGARNLDDVTIAHGLLVTDRIALRGASLLRAELLRSELLP